jgi:multidrug resistance efflux pump
VVEEKIEIRSDEVQEVLGYTPKWITRWGISVFFIIFFILLFGSWVFKYPDIIEAPITITTENPPTPIIARSSGKIIELFVEDTQYVFSNQYLAYIENSASVLGYIETKEKLNSLRGFFADLDTSFFNIDLEPKYSLGDLQTVYSSFYKKFVEYKDFVNLNLHQRKIKAYENQIEKHNLYLNGLNDNYKISKQEHEISRNQFVRDSVLLSEGLISTADFETTNLKYLLSKHSLSNASNEINSTNIQVSGIQQSILNLELDFKQQKSNFENDLKSQYQSLLRYFEQFEYDYLLKSPIEGKVAFSKYWSTNQYVTSGETVFTIIPSNPKVTIGKVKLPLKRSGKVKIGCKVIIKIDNYPYEEYGAIIGVVESISLVALDNWYIAEVSLTEGLVTNYNTELALIQKMQGTAEVVTEDIRLIERLFQPLKYILRKNFSE